MSAKFNPEKTIISSEVPKEIEVDQCFALPEWITDKCRYWIERGRWGYRGHQTVLVDGVRGKTWCYIYIEDTKQPTKTLKPAIKRIMAVIAYYESEKKRRGDIS